MDRQTATKAAKQVLSNIELQIKEFNLDLYDQIQVLRTAAVIVEPIQGEAGVVLPDKGYLKELRKLCNKKKILLIIDEIQTGTGRTGKFFAFKYSGIKPDLVCVAKGIANGVPIGVTIAVNKVAKAFKKGDHGSTFGGGCLSCAAANAVVDFIENKKLMNIL